MSASPEDILRTLGRREPRTYGRFKVYTLGDEVPKIDRPYLLKGIIYKGDLIFITGDPGSGKTTLAQYIALAIAQGRSIFGRRVHSGRVFYCAFEGKDLFLVKMSVFERAYGSSTNVTYTSQSMRLIDNAPFGPDAKPRVPFADQRTARPGPKVANKFYKSKEWLALRAQALKRDNNTCVTPGCGQPARYVDHRVSRPRGVEHLTPEDNLANLRSLCVVCDVSTRERPDGSRPHGGVPKAKGCNVDGSPISPDHPWHRPK